MGLGFDPLPILLIRNANGFIGNHFARTAYRAVHGPHGAGPNGLGDEIDFQTGITSRTYGMKKDVTFQTDLRSLLYATF